jgi:hypothetical protein
MGRMFRVAPILCLVVVAGCLAPAHEYVMKQQAGYKITQGFVIRLSHLESPVIEELKDGKAYTVTKPGCVVVLEVNRGRRLKFELKPGDRFVHGRPYAFVMQKQ